MVKYPWRIIFRLTEPGLARVQFGKPGLHFRPRQIARRQRGVIQSQYSRSLLPVLVFVSPAIFASIATNCSIWRKM